VFGKRAVDQASHDVDVAAQRACDQINAVTSTDGLNDSWWDDVSKVVEAVARIAETISAITGILGMLLAWVPILGPALLAISAITGVIAAICNVALAAGGKQSWGDALKSVFFAAIGCLGLGGLKGILGSIKGLALFGKTAKNAGGIAKFLKAAAVAGVKDFAHNAKTLFTGLKTTFTNIRNLGARLHGLAIGKIFRFPLSGKTGLGWTKGDPAMANVPKLKGEEGFFDFVAHGSPDDVVERDLWSGEITATYSAEDVAEMIRKSREWNQQDIRLVCCKTGQKADGFAQQLANILKVRVKAPTTNIQISNKGNTYFKKGSNGEWRTFDAE
jgi:hypothetical protein